VISFVRQATGAETTISSALLLLRFHETVLLPFIVSNIVDRQGDGVLFYRWINGHLLTLSYEEIE
jgi:hypothetical protein